MSESVCGDLLDRLEKRLPENSHLRVSTEKKTESKDEDVLKDLVEQNRQLLQKMQEYNETHDGTASKKKEVMSQDFPLEEVVQAAPSPIISAITEEVKVEEIKVAPTVEPAKPAAESRLSTAYEELSAIVDTFNKSLSKWYEDTGCVAGFSWRYRGRKSLEVDGIDYIVYRKDAPSDESLKSILEKYKP